MKTFISWSHFRSVAALTVFCATSAISLMAQNDRLATALSSVHNVQDHDNKMRARQTQLNNKPAMKAKLDNMTQQIATQKKSFQVAYTPAMDRTKAQLVGTKRPPLANASAVKQQDDMNEKIVTKAQNDLRQERVSAPDVSVSQNQSKSKDRSRSLPASYFAGLTLLPEIKDQKDCGSCWAFAACATFETTFRKFYGTSRTVDLSEQDLIDCGKSGDGDDAGSCGGGYSDYALDYIRCFGTTAESNRPYTAAEGTCIKEPKTLKAYTWGQVYPDRFPTVDEVKKYLYTYGAVVTYMKAGIESFYAYKSGVYDDYPSDDPYDVDHAVVLVGWDDLTKSWIVRNSWGKEWGYSGYSYVSYNACNIGKWIYWVYPKFTNKQVSTSGPSGSTAAQEEPFEASPLLKGRRN